MTRRLTQDAFYAERDKRTQTETAGASIAGFRCALVLPENATTYATQATALLTVNVLSRFCRDLLVVGPDEAPHPALRRHPHLRSASVPVALRRLSQAIDPFIRVDTVRNVPAADGRHLIYINPTEPRPGGFTVLAHGWNVTLGSDLRTGVFGPFEDKVNPLGPAFGAFLAAADAFKVASGAYIDSRIQEHTLDLWAADGRPGKGSTGPAVEDLDLRRSLLVGVGGVGSCFCYLLSLGWFRGHMALVDHDLVDVTNLNRCLPFLFTHALSRREKVRVARRLVEQAGVVASPFSVSAGEFFALHGRQPGQYDQVFAVANEDGAYRHVQNSYPPTVMHASTSPNWQVNAGHHEPLVDPCVVCELGGTETARFKCEDGVEASPSAPERRLGSLPFLAPLAGAMLLRTALRRALGVETGGAIQSLNLTTPDVRFTARRAMNVEECICRQQDPDLHRMFLATAADKASV